MMPKAPSTPAHEINATQITDSFPTEVAKLDIRILSVVFVALLGARFSKQRSVWPSARHGPRCFIALWRYPITAPISHDF